jgi:hypothetical protein
MTAPHLPDPERVALPQTVRLVRPTAGPFTSTRGPKALVLAGALVLVASLVLVAVVVRAFVTLLPLDVLDGDGGPGPSVLASAGTPGELEADLASGTAYALLLAQPEPTGHTGLDGDLLVTGPDGSAVDLTLTGVSVNASRGGVSAHTVGSFRTTTSGTYTVRVPAMLDGSDSSVLLAPETPVAPFVAGVLGTVLGVFGFLLLLPVGACGVVGGGMWWRSRRRAQAALAATRETPLLDPPDRQR